MHQLSGRILIGEESPTIQGLREYLEHAGLAVSEASSGDAALAQAVEERPDVVVLDVDSSEIMAFMVCRVLRERHGQLLPIILTSAKHVETSDRIAGLLLGADEYIFRPFDLAELLARVRRFVDRSQGQIHLDRSAGKSRMEDFNLTRREQEVLGLLLSGLNQAEIAAKLVISPNTVATHIQRILLKMGVHNRAQAVAKAAREGWLPGSDVENGSQPISLSVVQGRPSPGADGETAAALSGGPQARESQA